MRILILSDIHANVVALEAVLSAVDNVDGLWCLGDTIGYGPRPNECIEHMRQMADYAISGNHDLACLGKVDLDDFNPDARTANRWNGDQLTAPNREWLMGLDNSIERLPTFRDFCMMHGSPHDPVWEYLLSIEQARRNFEHPAFRTRVCLVGHSHIPILFTDDYMHGIRREFPDHNAEVRLMPDTRYIINPGSVGQPRNQDPRAAFAILDTEKSIVKFHRIRYDVEKTQQQMREVSLPPALIKRLQFGL
jgi:predicted phosphodiesterase